MMANPLQNAAQMYLMGRQMKNERMTRDLSGKALMGDPTAQAELMQINPQMALQVQGQLQQQQQAAEQQKMEQQKFLIENKKFMEGYLKDTGSMLAGVDADKQQSILESRVEDLKRIFPEQAEMLGLNNYQYSPEMVQSLIGASGATDTANITDLNKYQELLETNPKLAKKFGRKIGMVDRETGEIKPTVLMQNVEAWKAAPEGSPEKEAFAAALFPKEDKTLDKTHIKLAEAKIQDPTASPEEKAWAQEILGIDEQGVNLYGAMKDKGFGFTQEMRQQEASYSGLSRAMDIIKDGQDAGVPLFGSEMMNYINKFKELGGADPEEDRRFSAAYGSATLDIARQLAQALRPVSGEQLRLVLDGLRGGTWLDAEEAIRGTMMNVSDSYKANYKTLEDANAGIRDRFPKSLKYERTPNRIQSEREEFFGGGTQQNPAAEPAAAPVVSDMSDDDLMKSLGL